MRLTTMARTRTERIFIWITSHVIVTAILTVLMTWITDFQFTTREYCKIVVIPTTLCYTTGLYVGATWLHEDEKNDVDECEHCSYGSISKPCHV